MYILIYGGKTKKTCAEINLLYSIRWPLNSVSFFFLCERGNDRGIKIAQHISLGKLLLVPFEFASCYKLTRQIWNSFDFLFRQLTADLLRLSIWGKN